MCCLCGVIEVYRMEGKFQVVAYWKGKRTIRYFSTKLQDGIIGTIQSEMEGRGFRFVDVKLMA